MKFSILFTLAIVTLSIQAFAKESVAFKCFDPNKKVVLSGVADIEGEDLSDPNYRVFNLKGTLNLKMLYEKLNITGSMTPSYRPGVLIHLESATANSLFQTARLLLNDRPESEIRIIQNYDGADITIRVQNISCSKN